MSAVMRAQQKSFSGLNMLQLVRQLVPNDALTDHRCLDEIGKHVRFCGHISYEHPKHEIAYIDAREYDNPEKYSDKATGKNKPPIKVYLNKHVMAGLLGPLPAPYMEMCYQQLRDGKGAMSAFFDVFNHRLNVLRYWMMARSTPDSSTSELRVSLPGRLINAVSGDQYGPLSPRNLLSLAGLLHDTQRSHSVVQLLLNRLLGLPVRLEAFRGGWLPLDEHQQIRLGQTNSVLGQSSVVGSHCWDQHKSLGIVIDMPDFDTLYSYLPPKHHSHQTMMAAARLNNQGYAWLSSVARWLTHYRYDLEITLRLPQTYNSVEMRSDSLSSPRLGYTSWIRESKQLTFNQTDQSWQIRFVISAQEQSS